MDVQLEIDKSGNASKKTQILVDDLWRIIFLYPLWSSIRLTVWPTPACTFLECELPDWLSIIGGIGKTPSHYLSFLDIKCFPLL
jgi:hypothetical protein